MTWLASCVPPIGEGRALNEHRQHGAIFFLGHGKLHDLIISREVNEPTENNDGYRMRDRRIAELEAELAEMRKSAAWSSEKIFSLVAERNEARERLRLARPVFD